jgi:hypothetical protein
VACKTITRAGQPVRVCGSVKVGEYLSVKNHSLPIGRRVEGLN